MSEQIYTIDQIKTLLVPIFRSYGVKKATLFGSYGKGVATGRSDVDLLVDSELRGLRFVGLMEDIGNAVDKDVDVLDVTHIEKGSEIESEIGRSGVVIYDQGIERG
ncbi:MAG: nucleotidyltransferase domain-containing protein [Clostridiales bacterium]|nr:nucleotidyltransferase domain-containing protein [Clostridiales bacterium]